VPRSFLAVCFICSLALSLAALPASAALLSLSVVDGLLGVDGSTILADPNPQESLSGSTLTQLGLPLLYDPSLTEPFGITVRITNTSGADVWFPEALPGVSVLTGVSGIPGYSSRQNVGAGGAGRLGGAGSEGAVSRTVIDLLDSLEAESSPASGSHGGGGGAATGVAGNWLSLTGASGLELAAYLAGVRLLPGAYVDIRDFVRVNAFERDLPGCRIAVGFDLPTFSYQGVSVTTAAWTGSFSEEALPPPPPPPPGPGPVTVSEPPIVFLAGAGLAGLALGGRRRLFARHELGVERACEHGKRVVTRSHDDDAVPASGALGEQARGFVAGGGNGGVDSGVTE